MKRVLVILAASLSMAFPSWLVAQVAQYPPPPPSPSVPQNPPPSPTTENHAEIGVYADYLRFAPGSATDNFVGVGGRIGVNIIPNLALEAEMNYDFARNYTSTYSGNGSGGVSTTFVTTRVRPLTGLFGPKLQFGTSGPFRAFLTGKVGFIDFSTSASSSNVSATGTANTIAGVGGSGTHLAVYPGGGIELFAGPIGLRAEVGDEIYLNNGTYNNIRVTFGPTFRF